MAVVRALTSPYSERPVNVTVNVGLCPEDVTDSALKSTVFGAVDGIDTFVQPVIEELSAFLIVKVADVYAKSAVRVKDLHSWIALASAHAIRGKFAPASNTAVGAGTAQLPGVPENVSYV
jgi:hypothetical protein